MGILKKIANTTVKASTFGLVNLDSKKPQEIARPEGTIMQLKGPVSLLTLYDKKVVIEHIGTQAKIVGIAGEHSFMIKDIIGVEMNKGGTLGSRGSIFFNHKGSQEMHDDTTMGMDSLKKAGSKNAVLRPQLEIFYRESTSLLEDGIRKVFAKELGTLVIPPERTAILIRIFLSGMVVELAQVNSSEQLEELDLIYADIRSMFERFVVEKVFMIGNA